MALHNCQPETSKLAGFPAFWFGDLSNLISYETSECAHTLIPQNAYSRAVAKYLLMPYRTASQEFKTNDRTET